MPKGAYRRKLKKKEKEIRNPFRPKGVFHVKEVDQRGQVIQSKFYYQQENKSTLTFLEIDPNNAPKYGIVLR